jgi:molybdopterin molybdotransferase
MTGHEHIFRRTVRATLIHDIEKKKGLRYFFRAKVRSEGSGFVAEITGEQGSGILSSMVLANGIMVIPEDADFVKAGSQVMVQLLDNSQNFVNYPEYLGD